MHMSKTLATSELEERKTGKDLYSYQKGAINKIFKLFEIIVLTVLLSLYKGKTKLIDFGLFILIRN